jgi:hypothetical protein
LRNGDWDFSDLAAFPSEMLRVACLYELDRELGSNNPPYLKAWELQEKEIRKAKLRAHLKSNNCLSKDCLSESELLALLPLMPADKSDEETETTLKSMLQDNPDMSPAETAKYWKLFWEHHKARQHKLDTVALSEVNAKQTNWKPPSPQEPEPILKSHPYEGLAEKVFPYHAWVNGSASSHCTVHPLEIDWTLTETELVEAFRNWLRHGDHNPFHPSYKRLQKKVGKRKKAGWLSWLRELAVYRISEAGFTRPQGLKMLRIATMSAANWEHAQARTLKRLEQEYDRLEHVAWNQGAPSQDTSPNWWDHFVKPFRL